jgi:sugar (pentulose or hexulose) kinase
MDVSLILDIGKTNKKLLLFDRQCRIVKESQTSIPEIEGEDGMIYDDLPQMLEWMDAEFRKIGAAQKYNVRAINVTTFGATVVHLNAAGDLATRIFSYMADVSEDIHHQFIKAFSALPGGFARLATPPLGKFLNVAKQLFWLTNVRPELASEIANVLFLPQFFIYKLTGGIFSEATSLGCHTGLWDFKRMHPSTHALKKLGLLTKLPPLAKNNARFELKNEYRDLLNASNSVVVGTGLHDSSSALVPFSRALKADFILVSTGTWVITQNPGAHFELSERDLAEDRLCYLTPEKKPVRAARLFAGREHEIQLARISKHFGKKPQGSGSGKNNNLHSYLKGFFAEKSERALLPAALQGSGPFPNCAAGDWDLHSFVSAEEAYARLCLDLAVLTSYCIDSVVSENTEKIVVDGGFAKNHWFVEILATLQVPRKLFVTQMTQATALGAALMAHDLWAKESKLEDFLEMQEIMPSQVSGLHLYAERYLARMAGDD